MALKYTTTDEKVTRAFASAHDLLFLPKDDAEALYIQGRLLEMGIRWADGKDQPTHLKLSVANGIVIQNGKIYCRGDNDDARHYALCTVRQLRADYMPSQEPAIPAETVADMFREMMVRMTRMEQ